MEEIEIFPIAEYYRLEPCDSKQGAQQLIFSDYRNEKISKYRVGIRKALLQSKGIYIFYDSRGRAIYAGKTDKQSLWKEINLAFNRDRGDLQKIKRTKQIQKNIEYQTYHEKERVIYDQNVLIHDLAVYFSAYHISPSEMIGPLEALIVRAFANDLLNKKMEKF